MQRAARAHPSRPRHPDALGVLRGRRRRGGDRDLRCVPPRAQGVRPRRQDARDEPGLGRARTRSRVRLLDPRPAPFRDRLDGAGHPAAVARADPVRRAPRRLPAPGRGSHLRRCRRPVDRDRLRPAPGEGRHQRRAGRDAGRGRVAAAHGAGDGRDHRPDAGRFRDRRRTHRARSHAARRHRHELRDRSRAR